jgi:uncharacterized protein YceK
MARKAGLLVLLTVVPVLVLTGCGTLANLSDGQVYGGVRSDARVGSSYVRAGLGAAPDPDPIPLLSDPGKVALGTFILADLPFSAVADTVLLPITLCTAVSGKADAGKAERDRTADKDG